MKDRLLFLRWTQGPSSTFISREPGYVSVYDEDGKFVRFDEKPGRPVTIAAVNRPVFLDTKTGKEVLGGCY